MELEDLVSVLYFDTNVDIAVSETGIFKGILRDMPLGTFDRFKNFEVQRIIPHASGTIIILKGSSNAVLSNDLIEEIDEFFRQLKPFQVSELCHLCALREALLLLRALDLNAMKKARIDQYGYIPQEGLEN